MLRPGAGCEERPVYGEAGVCPEFGHGVPVSGPLQTDRADRFSDPGFRPRTEVSPATWSRRHRDATARW